MRWRRLGAPVLAAVAFFILTYGYLYPGSKLLFEGNPSQVMSDDTDPVTTPFYYAALIRAYAERPADLLYGAVVLDRGHPTHGLATWVSWFERWFVVFANPWMPVEQISTAFVFCILMMTALGMYAWARALRWPEPVAIAAAIAWAFNPYTRLRAQVHFALAGLYHLPLIFLGLELIARRRGYRSLVIAAGCFLLACTTFSYLIVVAAALTPFYFAYLYARGTSGFRVGAGRLIVAGLPAVLFLLWNVARPIPPSAGLTRAEAFPKTGEVTGDEAYHGFLKLHAARPLDYLGSDVGLPGPSPEWVWPKRWINAHTLDSIGGGHPNERSNGIRWVFILIAAVALLRARGPERRVIWMFAAFAFFCFWLSLPPNRPFTGAGPSGWLWKLVPQVRVPSRAGIGVHFGILAMVGFFTSARRAGWGRLLILALPVLAVLEYPPFTGNISVAAIRPALTHLARGGHCGTGILYPPSINEEFEAQRYYYFQQRLRGMDCHFLNALGEPAPAADLRRRFPRRPVGDDADADEDQVIRLARCLPLDWIVFDELVTEARRTSICTKLGWSSVDRFSCVNPALPAGTTRPPQTCPE